MEEGGVLKFQIEETDEAVDYPTYDVEAASQLTAESIQETVDYPTYDVEVASRVTAESIQSLFPDGTKISRCEYSSEKDYTAVLLLKCKSKEEFKDWLTEFASKTNNLYLIRTTRPCKNTELIYRATYRCHRNTYPTTHKDVKKPSPKHTGCPAKLHIKIEAPAEAKLNRSRDPVSDYPTVVNLKNTHNHDIEPLPRKFKFPEKIPTERNITEDDDEDREIVHNSSDDNSENEQLNRIYKTKWKNFGKRLRNMNAKLRKKFHKNPKDFSPAIDSMLSKFESMETDADFLRAMLNFGNDQINVTADNVSTVATDRVNTVTEDRVNTVTEDRVNTITTGIVNTVTSNNVNTVTADKNGYQSGRPIIHTFIPEHKNNERKTDTLHILSKYKIIAPKPVSKRVNQSTVLDN